jgi:hypothetical protein
MSEFKTGRAWKDSLLKKASLKSQAEFYLDLCTQLVRSDPLGTTSHSSLERDIETLRSRFLSEGLSFLTKTLPKLGKALDMGLVSSRFNRPREFKSSHSSASKPAFLQAYFNLVFGDDGLLRDEVPPLAVKHLRQVLFFAYKLELPYDSKLEAAVVSTFKETDSALELTECDDTGQLLDLCARITEGVFSDFDPKDILPRHGPGAVATGERLEEKWTFRRLYSQIHQVYPYYDFFIVGRGLELLDRKAWYMSLERLQEGTAKVVLVPKDSRGPRLISAEPLEYQWIQQGLGRSMVRHFESVCTLTKGHINFTSQDVNRSLALASSSSQDFATLDLKDASDRVSLELVRRVFGNTPELLRALEATRSSATLLPNGEVVSLKKFAPMGSALCFPVEAYIFWVLLVAAAVQEARMPLKQAVRSVYVYGDDIIIPTTWADRCMRVLESVGLLVNRQKSCITGFFRESCGMDAYNGVPVTPLRLRKQFTDLATDGTVLSSYCALANHLAQCNYEGAADLIWDRLERVYGKIPYGTSTSSFPCRIVAHPLQAEIRNLRSFRRRWNRQFQRFEFLVASVLPVRRETKLDGWTRLLKTQVFPGDDDPSNVVLPRSTIIKRSWRAV